MGPTVETKTDAAASEKGCGICHGGRTEAARPFLISFDVVWATAQA
jgi:hypothetical protein